MKNRKLDYHNMKPKNEILTAFLAYKEGKEKPKMTDKIKYQDNTIILEDNKGGDALEIIDEGNGRYTFQVGHCCVWVIRKTGTISEICEFLKDIAMAYQELNLESVEPWFSEKIND